ncbi:hypothetical protein PGT21_003161 [Puccinia graminis f. sp. tritici]|uniref:Uncharacterized protein n=1 Tax=Puccinia graminis f. sp. tritici TaxID=56615 RepID=A0A5B0QML9_PUCGR|nr:hypothetical protein PGT21_003161 [Puccinia graminis f. sp. tritici]
MAWAQEATDPRFPGYSNQLDTRTTENCFLLCALCCLLSSRSSAPVPCLDPGKVIIRPALVCRTVKLGLSSLLARAITLSPISPVALCFGSPSRCLLARSALASFPFTVGGLPDPRLTDSGTRDSQRLQVKLTSQRPSWTRATPMMCVACTDPDGGNLGLTQGTEHAWLIEQKPTSRLGEGVEELLTKNPPANGWIPSRAPATWLRSIQRTLGRAWHHLDASESVQGMLGRRDHPEDGVQPGVHRTLDWECPMDNKKTINRTLLRVSD